MPFSLGRIGMRSPFAMSIAPEAFYEATLGLPKRLSFQLRCILRSTPETSGSCGPS